MLRGNPLTGVGLLDLSAFGGVICAVILVGSVIEGRYWEQIEVSGGRIVERIYRLRLKESVLSVQEIARIETDRVAAWGGLRFLKLTLKNEKILYSFAFAGAEELHLIAAKLDEVVRSQQAEYEAPDQSGA